MKGAKVLRHFFVIEIIEKAEVCMKVIKLAVVALAMVVLSPYIARAADWDIAFENKIGGTHYHEEYSTIDSKWNAFYYEGLISANYFKEKGLVGRVDLGIPVTASAEEQWDVSSVKYQTDDMKFWGMEGNIELGYAMPIIVDKMPFALLGGYGFNFTRFTRTNFIVLSKITSTAIVDEDYWVHHLDLGGKLVYNVSDKLKVDLKSMFGFVVYNSAHNSVLGDVNGDGGYTIRTETNVNYKYSENLALSLGGFFTFQHLEGGTSGNLVWPDNDLYTYGGNIAVKYLF